MEVKSLLLEPGETIIDTWLLFYSRPGEASCNARCTITTRRIVFVTSREMKKSPALNALYDSRSKTYDRFVIMKEKLQQTETRRSYKENRIILTMEDGYHHEFSYGPLNIDRLLEAVMVNTGISSLNKKHDT